MGDTSISWTDKSWNPGGGCSRVSEGCRNCYAERIAARFAEKGWSKGLINLKTGKWNGTVRLAPHKLAEPLSWRKPARVFVNSMTDLFHDGYTNEEIAAVFGVMAAAPQHTFQILTKRAKRMREWFEWVSTAEPMFSGLPDYADHVNERQVICRAAWEHLHPSDAVLEFQRGRWPLPNVWLGVSVENQDAADERIPELLATPAAVRFLSCEPLLGPVDLARFLRCPSCGYAPSDAREHLDHHLCNGPGPRLRWVIAGCESGPGARTCEVGWLRALRDQCAAAGVDYFLKQAVAQFAHSTSCAVHPLAVGAGSKRKPGAVIELPYLDGVQHCSFPEVSR